MDCLHLFCVHPSPSPKRHLDRYGRFRRDHGSAQRADTQTDKQTHRPRYSCNNRPHLCTACVRCDLMKCGREETGRSERGLRRADGEIESDRRRCGADGDRASPDREEGRTAAEEHRQPGEDSWPAEENGRRERRDGITQSPFSCVVRNGRYHCVSYVDQLSETRQQQSCVQFALRSNIVILSANSAFLRN